VNINLRIAQQIGIKETQVQQVIQLLDSDATIPFIARYRKEITGNLDEVQITQIRDISEQLQLLIARKETIIKSMEEQGLLTPDLQNQINAIDDKAELEDFYLPYKPKRKTKASIAKEKGLEPLAKMMMAQNHSNIKLAAQKFIGPKVETQQEALQGAQDIIAEWLNEHIGIRKRLRQLFWKEGEISTKLIKSKEEEAQRFQMYFDHSEKIKRVPAHRILAMMRGEKEAYLRLKAEPPEQDALQIMEYRILKKPSTTSVYIKAAIKDAYKRLLNPSLQTEIKNALKEKADDDSIKIFAKNLKELLLASPLKNKRVIAIDPGFRTGCKLVCLNENGDLLHNETIFPHPPQKERKQAIQKISSLADAYRTDVIAIGNGTAGKETEALIRNISFKKSVKSIMVNESGASVYSASPIAREEFPQYDITVRGAVSIGRRLIDPLSELVKIDPKAIGVGQYQHDVDQNKLSSKLDEVVMSAVNTVGVDLNTAGKQLLSYVSGIGPGIAANIVEYRKQNGNFINRKQLLQVKRLGRKAFEQSAGFLRIKGGNQVLDQSAVHPESYDIVAQMAKDLGTDIENLIGNQKLLDKLSLEKYITREKGLPTLLDIKKELLKPGLDPRKEYHEWEFDQNINHIGDLEVGMKLRGIVTNITAFGAFVDVGVHQDGLVHKSNIANEFISDPNEHLHIGQKIMVRVLDVDISRKRINLSIK